jgi:hypothetical protein
VTEHRVTDTEVIRLELMEIGKQEMMSEVELLRPEWHVAVDYMGRHIVAALTAYVLMEEGGEPVVKRTYYWQKLKPWWLPKFLWRRVPEQQEVAVAVAQPLFTYPKANVKVPELGPVVLKVREW